MDKPISHAFHNLLDAQSLLLALREELGDATKEPDVQGYVEDILRLVSLSIGALVTIEGKED